MDNGIVFATDRLLASFEAGDLHPATFRHRQHLQVALMLLASDRFDDALARMRAGLTRVLHRQGLDAAYHETVTQAWMRALAHRLARTDGHAPWHERESEVLEWCAQARPLERHYSKERLTSPEARTSYLEPDLLPFPAPAEENRA